MKNTTKPIYRNGYNAAMENLPRKSPHREGTGSETIWLEGYNAYVSGGTPPQEPRKKRTKEEMEAIKHPELPRSLRVEPEPDRRPTQNAAPRKPLLLDLISTKKDEIANEHDVELLEILHMELADLEWRAGNLPGEKPSDIWEEHKSEKGLTFEKKVA